MNDYPEAVKKLLAAGFIKDESRGGYYSPVSSQRQLFVSEEMLLTGEMKPKIVARPDLPVLYGEWGWDESITPRLIHLLPQLKAIITTHGRPAQDG